MPKYLDNYQRQKIEKLLFDTGKFLLSQFRIITPNHQQSKAPREFVTEVDRQSELRLKEELKKILPAAGFWGEEYGREGNKDVFWIIDPIDGTTNFISGLDQFCISLALWLNGSVQAGWVYRPSNQEWIYAYRGEGVSHLYHKKVNKVKKQPAISLDHSLIGTGFPYRSIDMQDYFFPCAKEILNKSRGIRRFGSAALDVSYLALGFLQGFWETDLQVYDLAATVLFLSEMGYKTCNEKGESYNLFKDRFIY